ncbi:hypothetical protein, partial, partial [Absidia glauca]
MVNLITCTWCEAYFYSHEIDAHVEECMYRQSLDSLLDLSSDEASATSQMEQSSTPLDTDMLDFNDNSDNISLFGTPVPDDLSETDSQTPINLTFSPSNMERQVMASFGLALEKIVLDNRHELLPSPYKSRKQLEMAYLIRAMRYDTCTDGCMLFTDDEETECLHCQQPRYNDDNLANRTINVLSVAEQLGLLLYNKGTRQDLRYRSDYETTGDYDDIFGGSYYQGLKEDHFTNQYDIAIGLYTDGFTPSSKSSSSLTMVHLVIYNYHPASARYSFYYTCVFYRVRTERMLQVCVMPGPKSPKGAGFWSFLRPLMDELAVLATAGMVVTCDDGTTVRSKVHLLVATGDMPAAATLSGHSGHMSTYGCPICPAKGVSGWNGRGKFIMPTERNLELAWWPSEVFLGNGAMHRAINPTPISDRPTFQGPALFALDEMHLFGHGLSSQLVSLMEGGKRDKKDYSKSSLFIGSKETARLFGLMEASRANIPVSFDGAFKKPFGKHTTRAVDWIDMARLSCISAIDPGVECSNLILKLAANKHLTLMGLQSRGSDDNDGNNDGNNDDDNDDGNDDGNGNGNDDAVISTGKIITATGKESMKLVMGLTAEML